MSTMAILSDDDLLKAYKKAQELVLDHVFIELLEEEIGRRSLKKLDAKLQNASIEENKKSTEI